MFSIDFLNRLRAAELETVIGRLPSAARVLEFGAGTGGQALTLQNRGFQVTAIDLASSGYASERVFPVIDYDGVTIPLPDRAVDVVYSSNVLEHVDDLAQALREFRRVTKPGGYGIHLMPSVSWRVWTFMSGWLNVGPASWAVAKGLLAPPEGMTRLQTAKKDLKLLIGSILPIGHGTSPEGISELWTFSAFRWKRVFETNGFTVEDVTPVNLFHTGHQLFGPRIAIENRQKLAGALGSAATLYLIRPTEK